MMNNTPNSDWIKVCHREDLVPNLGIAALVDGHQVALFYLPELSESVFALDNWDPIGKAHVISRGIIGDLNGTLCVASPLFKQHFALESGKCLEVDNVSLRCWQTHWHNDTLWVKEIDGSHN